MYINAPYSKSVIWVTRACYSLVFVCSAALWWNEPYFKCVIWVSLILGVSSESHEPTMVLFAYIAQHSDEMSLILGVSYIWMRLILGVSYESCEPTIMLFAYAAQHSNEPYSRCVIHMNVPYSRGVIWVTRTYYSDVCICSAALWWNEPYSRCVV